MDNKKTGNYYYVERHDSDRDCSNRKEKEYGYDSGKKQKDKIFLECGHNPQDAIFEIDDGEVECDQKFVLDSVIVDTSRLCKPIVKIEFSSLVQFEAEDESGDEHEVEVNLLFELERICGGDKQIVQSWKLLKEYDVEGGCIDELEVELSEPFTVTFCDRACPGCCEYRMTVRGKDFEGDFEHLRVVKPSLSAIAQGLTCDCD
ncbi:MAG: DUF4489 domain-containing protein [Clostridiales bacterium]|nr:DUF4489 domain-containing protein [Clostridiales bacterium]